MKPRKHDPRNVTVTAEAINGYLNGHAEPLKHDKGKVRLELVPPEFVEAVARVLTFGAQKYSAGNWASGEGFKHSRLLGGLKRHIAEYERGVTQDPESGEHPLAHAGCMLCFLLVHIIRGLGEDDLEEIGTRARKRAKQ